ncbi:MAG: hypothetical protein ABJH45_03555 [Paracoccaceae bacterium]
MPIDSIHQPEVMMCLAPIWTDKHETAKRLAQRIKTVLDVARSKGFRDGENPVTAIKDAQALPKVKAKVQHHKAMHWRGVPAFYADLRGRNAMAAKVRVIEGQGYTNLGLSRKGYAGSAKINAVVRAAFEAVQMPQYTPHALRKTLVKFGDVKCTTMEEWKAWSMNLGHESMATTFNSYLPVTTERQMELIRKMSE